MRNKLSVRAQLSQGKLKMFNM